MAPVARDWPRSVLLAARLAIFAAVCAALYFGKSLLIPLVLAALLTFLLSPLVARLDALRVPRIAGVLLVMALVTVGVGGFGYVVAGQLREFAAELPKHRDNIIGKIRDLAALTRQDAVDNVQDTIEDLSNAVEEEVSQRNPRGNRREEPVVVAVERESSLFGSELLGSAIGFIGTAGLTFLLAIFMLVQREDLRNRLVSVTGRHSLAITTKAFADAGARISRYLLMQFVVNATMGLAVGLGLFLIGVPYAALFGLAAAVLRYIPYVGPWVAALLPIVVSLVTSPGWNEALLVIGMFIVLELLSNNVMEPLLYGHSVGLSALAVIVAAIFWTLIWGAVGLVIATPITACLVVLASYVPQLGVVGRLLGERPALSPHAWLYQRLLARDLDEAEAILERHRDEHSLESAGELLIRVLVSLKRDVAAESVEPAEAEFVCQSVAAALEPLTANAEATTAPRAAGGVLLLGVPGDAIDGVALEVVRTLLREEPCRLEIASSSLMIGELIAAVEARKPEAVVVLSLAPASLAPVRHLCKRVRGGLGQNRLVAARLGEVEEETERRIEQLRAAGAETVTTTLQELVAKLAVRARAAVRRSDDGVAARLSATPAA